MRRSTLRALILLIGASSTPGLVNAQKGSSLTTAGPSSAPPGPPAAPDSPEWLFPITRLNRRLPPWLRIGGEFRNRLEGPTGINFTPTSDFYLLERLRMYVTIQPKDWLTFHGEVQDARIFFNHHVPNANPYQDTWTLWEGYVQAGSYTSGSVDVVGGRQVLLFGDQRVIGPSSWSNVGRTFNVARMDAHHLNNWVSVFASSVVPGDNDDLHNALPGNNLYGIYGSLDNFPRKSTFQPYALWRVAPANPLLPEEVRHGHLNEYTFGLRLVGDLPVNFDYDTEFNGQTGSLGRYRIRAWAGYAGIGKAFPGVLTSPRVFLEGNYASGTKNPAGRDWNTFDQLYPSNHDRYGFADQVGRRNLEHFRVGVEEALTKKWEAKQQFEGFWLVTSNDNFYNSAGAVEVPAHPGASRHIGDEADVVFEYEMSKGLSFGFGYGRLFAGQFLKTTTSGRDYGYPYAYFHYYFSKPPSSYPFNSNRGKKPLIDPDRW